MKTGMNRYSSASTDHTASAPWRSLSRDLDRRPWAARDLVLDDATGGGCGFDGHQIAAWVRLRAPSSRAYRKIPIRMNSISVKLSAAACG